MVDASPLINLTHLGLAGELALFYDRVCPTGDGVGDRAYLRLARGVNVDTKVYGDLPYTGFMAETTARLEARLPMEVHALLKRAAEIEGRTLTDFVVSAARNAAYKTIEQTEIIRLSVEDQRRLAQALLNPPKPNRALKKAFRQRRKLFGGE